MSSESKEHDREESSLPSSSSQSSQTHYRELRLQLMERMMTELWRMQRLPKKDLQRIPMPWFKWVLKSMERREIIIPKEIKKRVGKPRKSELRYYDNK